MRRRWVVLAVVLAGLSASCSGSDKGASSPTTKRSTTTTSSSTTSTTATPTTVPASTTTSRATTPTTSARPDCSSRAVVGGVEATQAPAAGTYRYLACSSGALSRSIVVGTASAPTERTLRWEVSFGTIAGLNSYQSGVTQVSAIVQPKGVSMPLHCTWDNPLVVYPSGLAMNSSWRSDGRCEMEFQQSLQFNRFSRATGTRSFSVAGQSVRVLVIEETTDLLHVDSPRRNSTSWHSESTIFFDPARGLPVYERRISEATGQYPQAKSTTEVVLSSLSPS